MKILDVFTDSIRDIFSGDLSLVALSKALTKMQQKKQLLIRPEGDCYHITVIK